MGKTSQPQDRTPQVSENDLRDNTKGIFRWTLSLGNKLRHKVPLATALCITASLGSQVAMLVAFLLPLKVVILLGSEGIPRYYPSVLAGLNKEMLIIGLSLASVISYGLHLLGEALVKRAADQGARQLLASTGKLQLFENQDEIASTAYKQLTTALAGSLFVFLAMLLLLWLYPTAFFLLLVYGSLASAVLTGIARHSNNWARMEKNPLGWTAIVTSIGFLLTFSGIVADFLIGPPPSLTPAIIALLLSRQLTNKVKASINSLLKLLQQRTQVDALFFHRQILLTEPEREKTIWSLLQPAQRQNWAPLVLANVLGQEFAKPARISWWPLHENNIAALLCEYPEQPPVLLKLFERNRSNQAQHEATLLSNAPARLPAPALIGTTDMHGLHCHLFSLPTGTRRLEQPSNTQLQSLISHLLGVQAAEKLQVRYCRSHPLLGQRLNDRTLLRLGVATTPKTEQWLLTALRQLEDWRRKLHRVPLGFSVKVEPGSLAEGPDGTLLLLHWGKWALEPCGFDWSNAPPDHQTLQQSLKDARSLRPDLRTAETDSLTLVALSARLEHCLLAQDFEQALALLPAINTCLKKLDPADSH